MTSLTVLGPWPADNSGFLGAEYARRTLGRLDAMPGTPKAGPIRVGLAEVDLTPTTPRPLAGFIGQIRTPFIGVDTPCFARALTIESSSGTSTILTADLLLIDARMARTVAERAGVRPDEVYFTASHTHGGPGGWGNHPLEMLVAGAYDPAYFETLADQLADVVRRSRDRLEPAEFGFVRVEARDRQKNRVDPALPTHDALSGLIFRPLGAGPGTPPIAVVAVFGAHATVSHPIPPRLGGDYPAALASELKRITGARAVLFASGAVGDASPARPKAASSSGSAEALGIALAGDLAAALPSARFSRDVEVAGLRLEVDLPPVQLPFFSPLLKFGPALTWWIADRQTHLHALRIGPAVLIGFPGDYSGHLADALAGSTRESGLDCVATSFDGDFRGYLVSESVFRRKSCYETRWMSFYGATTGDYLNDLARRMVDRLSGVSAPGSMRRTMSAELAPRFALGALLAGFLATGRRKFAGWRHRAGLLTVGVASAAVLASLIEPEWVAWSRVGLPTWLRLAGLPVGVVALVTSKRRGASAALGLAFSLLTSSWLVALMTLRGLAISRLRDISEHLIPIPERKAIRPAIADHQS